MYCPSDTIPSRIVPGHVHMIPFSTNFNDIPGMVHLIAAHQFTGTGKKHEAWVTTRTADSDLYDDAFWADISSAFCYYQGEWYYAQKNSSMTLNKRSDLLTGEEETVYTSTDIWGGWQGCFTYLSQANGQIYLNTGTAIHRLNADGTVVEVYAPQIPEAENFWVYHKRQKSVLCASDYAKFNRKTGGTDS